ncbi:MAG TPA: hypothetical protein VGQ99_12805 [Tepidisphaeraceae bacterium]|nr:hypothetical protein [Tepidisphaeraceae bacterium]
MSAIPLIEAFESRILLADFTVISTADSDAGTLRQAILDANAAAGADTILFNISGTGIKTIALTSALPIITDPIFIDAASQPGYAGTPLIELNGSSAGTGKTGLVITAGNSTVRGLTINRFRFDGIELSTSGGNSIYANWIGTNNTASGASANAGVGIYINNIANNTIGGNTFTVGASTFSARNVISGNTSDGILIQGASASGNTVNGNYIGVRADGTGAIANKGNGVDITGGAHDNLIGGTATADRNVISGNSRNGIQLSADNTSANLIQGNYIGLRPNGATAQGNGTNGVAINGLNAVNVSANVIGGAIVGARNIISGNSGDGIQINDSGASGNLIQGNYIGTDFNGSAAVPNNDGVNIISAPGNTIGGTVAAARNIISGNRLNGVELQDTGAIDNIVRGNYIGLRADGSAGLGNQDDGVDINSTSNNIIGGTEAGAGNVISSNASDGIEIAADINRFAGNSTANLVQGNFIGTNAAGTLARPNAVNGIRIVENTCMIDVNPACAGLTSSVQNNTIGGAVAAARNIISGNGANGIHIIGANATANLVHGNYIGTDITGALALANFGSGVAISGGSNNIIGGTTAGVGNVISANGSDGVTISSLLTVVPVSIASANTVQGNLIGTAANGSNAMGNAHAGVHIIDSSSNVIGGIAPGAANIIAFNGGSASSAVGGGVFVQTTTGSAEGNSVRRNSIYSNTGPVIATIPTGLGIDLGPAGVSPNDSGDPDSGANSGQNFPLMATATTDGITTTIKGSLNSTPNSTFDLEFFASVAADPTGFGEGRTFLISTAVNTDVSGDATFTISVPGALLQGAVITATATSAAGSTSEFSNAIAVSGVMQITGTEADDIIRLVRSSTDPALLDIFINNAGPSPTSSINYASAGHIAVETLGGDDTLILDYSLGEVIPSGGINYDGGASTIADLLHIIGASAADAFLALAADFHHGSLTMTYASVEALQAGPGQFNFNSDLAGLNLSIDPSATAIFNASQHIPSLSIAASGLARFTAGGAKVLVVDNLNIAQSAGLWTGTLDLSDNDLIIPANALTRAEILNRTTSQVRSGKNSGGIPSTRWQGTGIATSAAALVTNGITGLAAILNEKPDGLGGTTTLHGTFAGESVDINAVLVKYTYTGDADLDGDIDADDYAHIDAGFTSHLAAYGDGDFDYSATIDADDYFLIDRAFSDQSAPLSVNQPNVASSPYPAAFATLSKNRITGPNIESTTLHPIGTDFSNPGHKHRKSAWHRLLVWLDDTGEDECSAEPLHKFIHDLNT